MRPGDAVLDLDGAFGHLAFSGPIAVHRADRLEEVRPAIDAALRAAAAGRWVAGLVAYEAAPAFDRALRVRSPGPGDAPAGPLAWLAEYDRLVDPSEAVPGEARLGPLRPDEDRDAHHAAVEAIREGIARGDFYQVNHTFRLRGSFAGDPLALYLRLRGAQGGGLGACLHLGDRAVVSASPELFLRVEGRHVTARPMKGTARRGRWVEEDELAAARLAASEKDRAENVMIVDLLRNDLGRVAEAGSVRAAHLFEVERWRTVLQLTSTVEARLRPGADLADLLAATFPCGSVTGAPKVAAMARIAASERSPRGVYCGAIGAIAPGGDAAFNVAIRTVEIDLQVGVVTAGVGGGITWGSSAGSEYDEALAKGAFLAASPTPPALVETLRLERGEYPFLPGHLARLAASARHLGLEWDRAEVEATLRGARVPGGDARVRLVVEGRGAVTVERAPLPELPAGPVPVALAAAPVSRQDPRLFHKTTDRTPYDEARRSRPGAFDVLLWNEEREATEFTIGNLVLDLDGERITPPRDAGLLAGVFRAELLARGEVRERTVTLADLARARRLWLVNALRGWVEVRLAE